MRQVVIRQGLQELYPDVYTPEALEALEVMARFNQDVKDVMKKRIERRARRMANHERIQFLNPNDLIPGTNIKVQDAQDGKFKGSSIPHDLERQWIQGTGPAARPRESTDRSLRNPAYALLSGADGWMFDGEDANGQVDWRDDQGNLRTQSLENQRNLKLALHQDPLFMQVAQKVAGEMNKWARGFLKREIIRDWKDQLKFTTRIFRARGLHLDDRNIQTEDGEAFSASIVDTGLYMANNISRLLDEGRTPTLYLPKIQTAEEAAFWDKLLYAFEDELAKKDPRVKRGTIKVYVLIEQLAATYHFLEIRAALSP